MENFHNKGVWEFAQPVMLFVDLKKGSNCNPHVYVLQEWGYLTHCYDPFGPHFAVRAWTYWQLFAPGVGLGQVFMVKFKIFENPWISTPYKTLFKYQKHIFPIIL